MDNKNIGNNKLPSFTKLDDRIIAKHSSSPSLVIRTNLDEKDATEQNPYFNGSNEKEIKEYFEE
ncbi:hypothetical protein ACQCT6_19840 [Cytobacillus gottheilii]|uniref:Uncharacterized protein n=1 Tax=Cytobacillus gottheilii TaxID=859144 RepID=A0ABX8F9Q6_9BACI|nr:hypothetical protein [Cytobacillus gottheilii]QVY59877.1 hypothetical protein J1899_12515 [Cytobacillus gottheilii]